MFPMIPMIAIGIDIHTALTYRLVSIEKSATVAVVAVAADAADDDGDADEVSLSASAITGSLIKLGSVIFIITISRCRVASVGVPVVACLALHHLDSARNKTPNNYV